MSSLSSVGRAPTSATEPSVQLDLKSGTICRRTRTYHTAVLDSPRRLPYLGSWTTALCLTALCRGILTHLLTYYSYPQLFELVVRQLTRCSPFCSTDSQGLPSSPSYLLSVPWKRSRGRVRRRARLCSTDDGNVAGQTRTRQHSSPTPVVPKALAELSINRIESS